MSPSATPAGANWEDRRMDTAELWQVPVTYAAIGRLGGYPIVSSRPGSGPIVVLP